MSIPFAPLACYAVTAPGVETLTATELRSLGITPGEREPGGVAFSATTRQLYAANLQLRTATRILVRIGTFDARTFFELERHARGLPWARFVPAAAAIEFHVTSKKSKLYHQDAVAERLATAVSEAVGDRILNGETVEPDDSDEAPSDSRGPQTQLFVIRINRDRFTVSADSSGALLYRRGYRQAIAKAPLRETLAAAMLLGAGWDGTMPLLDPFCGSGTILIEAALLARRIAPGLHRSFSFEGWPEFEPETWASLKAEADAAVLPAPSTEISGSDRDAGAIEAARSNAERAGVSDDLSLRCVAISGIEPGCRPGWIITNPPYGKRVGVRSDVRDLYAQFGNVVRRGFERWGVAVLSADPMLDRQTQLPFTVRWSGNNGGIPVRLVVAAPKAAATT